MSISGARLICSFQKKMWNSMQVICSCMHMVWDWCSFCSKVWKYGASNCKVWNSVRLICSYARCCARCECLVSQCCAMRCNCKVWYSVLLISSYGMSGAVSGTGCKVWNSGAMHCNYKVWNSGWPICSFRDRMWNSGALSCAQQDVKLWCNAIARCETPCS